jgi:hypothetical protein
MHWWSTVSALPTQAFTFIESYEAESERTGVLGVSGVLVTREFVLIRPLLRILLTVRFGSGLAEDIADKHQSIC